MTFFSSYAMEARHAAVSALYASVGQSHVLKFYDTLSAVCMVLFIFSLQPNCPGTAAFRTP